MKVLYGEGVANHTSPESCVLGREAGIEALTGEHVGWVLSREKNWIRDADAVLTAGRPHEDRWSGRRPTRTTSRFPVIRRGHLIFLTDGQMQQSRNAVAENCAAVENSGIAAPTHSDGSASCSLPDISDRQRCCSLSLGGVWVPRILARRCSTGASR